jgi:outer membrane lipoprotein SlyB
MSIRPITTALDAVALSALTACATSPGYNQPHNDPYYSTAAAQPTYDEPVRAEYGVVRAIDIVPVASRPSGAGAVLGAIVGGVVGHQFGSGTGNALTTIGGAVGGAAAGNAIEQRTRRDDEVFRVTVRFDDGSVRDFDYQRIDDLRVGDRVKLEDGQLHFVR